MIAPRALEPLLQGRRLLAVSAALGSLLLPEEEEEGALKPKPHYTRAHEPIKRHPRSAERGKQRV